MKNFVVILNLIKIFFYKGQNYLDEGCHDTFQLSPSVSTWEGRFLIGNVVFCICKHSEQRVIIKCFQNKVHLQQARGNGIASGPRVLGSDQGIGHRISGLWTFWTYRLLRTPYKAQSTFLQWTTLASSCFVPPLCTQISVILSHSQEWHPYHSMVSSLFSLTSSSRAKRHAAPLWGQKTYLFLFKNVIPHSLRFSVTNPLLTRGAF